MTLALLFPGQGAQHAAMLPWLESTPGSQLALQAVAAELGADWRARVNDSDWASINRHAQPLIVGTSIAAWHAVAPALPKPVAVAGYSVGELSACCCADVFDLPAALDLARQRAGAMDASTGAEGGAMLAVSGSTPAAIDAACERYGVGIAIRIGPQRCVLAGTPGQVAAAGAKLSAAGATCNVLGVRVASHTPAMRQAAGHFAQHIEPLPWRAPRQPVVCNLDASGLRNPDALKTALAGQIAQTVQWDNCMDAIAERRPDCVLEVGPGSGLSRIWEARHPDIPARSTDEFSSAEAVVDWVLKRQG